MGWFSDMFSSSSSNSNARRKTTLSTHDAFSLPTSSPITASHPGSFARSGFDTPDIDTAASPTYAYPPPMSSPTTYDYVPRQNGRLLASQSRRTSLLPLHNNTPLSPLPPYPPLEQTWARLQRWLSREYPELGDTLNYGILPQDLGEIEMALGTALPPPVRESYLLIDGQEAESSAGCSEGLFFGLSFLPLEDVLEEWRFWREVDSDPATGANTRLREVMQSIPPGYVRRNYSQRGWIPLVTDKTGNYLGIDLNPDEHGSVGQVIVFGRDFDTKVVMWRGDGSAGWAHWLANFVEDLENGEGFELGHGSDGSENEEDDVGYESYFYDGSGGTKGEGGGDSSGGLRLNGEYRGWSVLEAWADKSVKKWREAGLLPKPAAAPKPKAKGKHGLGVLDLAAGASSSSAEVPIPVLGDRDESNLATPTAALTNVTNRMATDSPTEKALPTISVTKPPAPLPVNLPSPQDFQSPSPTDSRGTSFDETDLESGRQLSLDEVEHPLSGATVSVKSSSPTTPTARRPNESISTVKEATLVQIPLDDSPSGETLVAASPDLLLQNDASDVVQIPVIEPVTTPVSERKPEVEDVLPDTTTDTPVPETPLALPSDAPSVEAKEEQWTEVKVEAETMDEAKEEPEEPEEPVHAQEDEEEAQEPDQTIRLVGGGGQAGIVSEPSEPVPAQDTEAEPDRADVASISSATSPRTSVDSSSGAKGGKHEKKKSFSSGLKRIGKLGSGGTKRRTDSKEKVGEP
ncbi:hypothetical protein DFH11DRAFT_1578152 [Phellopilus nigrolimitatus]|nr:hypothetical protein DFH11DRAFT_1578152 [Phellopilus nigrolimitatus]